MILSSIFAGHQNISYQGYIVLVNSPWQRHLQGSNELRISY